MKIGNKYSILLVFKQEKNSSFLLDKRLKTKALNDMLK